MYFYYFEKYLVNNMKSFVITYCKKVFWKSKGYNVLDEISLG